MKQVTTINSAPKLPNWPAAAQAAANGVTAAEVLAALLDLPLADGAGAEFWQALISAITEQRAPSTSIYDRLYTAHIYPEPGVAEGQVYEALRDYAAQHATPDPAMVEIRNREILEILDSWKAEGPPSPEDVEFWRKFDEDLARARRGADAPAARELEQKLADAEEAIRDLTAKQQHAFRRGGSLNLEGMLDLIEEYGDVEMSVAIEVLKTLLMCEPGDVRRVLRERCGLAPETT